MAVSDLDTGSELLLSEALGVLADAGYPYHPLTTDLESYLATALSGIGGIAVSKYRVGFIPLLAGLANALDAGPVSPLTSSVDDLLAAIVNSSGSPPSDIPSWVQALAAPSGDLPTIVADFKNDRYWDGTAEVAAADLLEENSDWALFDPATIVPGFGMGCLHPANNAAPVIKPALIAGLLATGITNVITANVVDGGGAAEFAFDCELVELPGFNTEYWAELFCIIDDFPITSTTILSAVNQTDNLVQHFTSPNTPGIHKIATLLSTAKVATSIDGAAQTTLVPTETPDTPWNNIVLQTNDNSADALAPSWMEMVAIYPPQPETDLPTLSAA